MSKKSSYQDFFKKAKERSQQLKSGESQSPASMTHQSKEIKIEKKIHKNDFKLNKTISSKKNKNYFSYKGIVFSIFGVLICGGYMFYGDGLESFTSKFHVSFFEKTLAQENSKINNERPLPSTEEEMGDLKSPKVDHLKNLVKLQGDLQKKEEELMKFEQANEKKALEIEKNLKELERLRDEISTKLADRLAADSKKIDQLVEVYSTMRPAQAAKIFEDLTEELAVQVLSKMKKKNAAEILNLMNVEKAKKFAELFTGYQNYENK